MKKNLTFKRGGVSMFLVIVASSLIALIVASFMRLVIRDQSQASNQDLSQSAYDSAQVGVEDAKRFMTKYAADCASGYDLSTTACNNMKKALDDNTCNTLYGNGSGVTSNASGETLVQTSSGDSDLNQAYTCVKITKNTADFIGQLTTGQSKIVPLRGTKAFSKVKLSWHSKEDMSDVNKNIDLDKVLNGTPSLLSNEDYEKKVNRPATIKAQFFGYNTNMKSLSDLDSNFSGDGVGLNEQIYYPVSNGTSVSSLPTGDRRDSEFRTKELSLVKCESSMAGGAVYACSVTISLNRTVSASDTAFMRLTPIYKATNFKAELLDDAGNSVDFDGVQPRIDSTGRANDQFRRVESRVEFVDQNMPVPDFALQLEDAGNPLCKNFWVTNLKNNIDEVEKTCGKSV